MQGWSKVKQNITVIQKSISAVMSKVQTCNKKLETLPAGALVDLHWANCGAGESGEGTAEVLPSQSAGFAGVMDVTFKSLGGYLNAAGNPKCTGSASLGIRQGNFQ